MIFDDPTQNMGSPDASAPGIFTRINLAISKAKHVRLRMEITTPPVVFLGEQEWHELSELCQTFGVEWKGGDAAGYFPADDELKRAEFGGFKIYRVDSKSFIAAL